jgi:hypothetical protein
LVEPDPNSKNLRVLTPEKGPTLLDQLGILAAHINGTAVLEYGPTEILPAVLAKWKALRVSADPVAKAAAHTRAESRDSRDNESRCGRETDCLLEERRFELSVPP